jgi:murein L,D-transpeptidase YafK
VLLAIGVSPQACAQQVGDDEPLVIEQGETIRIDREAADQGLRSSTAAAVVESSTTDGYAILIDKCLHTLQVYRDGEAHQRYLDIGVSYPGDKERSGDGRTPEGLFYGRLYSTSSFGNGKAILLSYPDAEDAARALAEGIITAEQHDLIVQAQENRNMPPMWTAVGGSIAVHSDNDQGWYWTTGCPTLSTTSISELYELLYPVFGHSRNITVGIIPCDPA